MSVEDRKHVAAWVAAERAGHADPKWKDSPNRRIALTHMREDSSGEWWKDYVASYMHRASVLRLDTAAGRQALAKALVTLTAAVETAVEVYGPLPKPGLSSGNVEPWVRPEKPPEPWPDEEPEREREWYP